MPAAELLPHLRRLSEIDWRGVGRSERKVKAERLAELELWAAAMPRGGEG